MEQKYYYYDLHCHTNSSPDAPGKLKNIVKMAKKRGLDGVAITDHNKVYRGPLSIDGIDIIPGSEINVKGGAHLLAYFIKNKIKKNKDFKEVIKEVHSQGGVAVWAHPLRSEGVFEEKNKEVLHLLYGMESGNAMDLKIHQEETAKHCKEQGLLQTAGSDSHTEGQIGMAVVRVSEKLKRTNFIDVVRLGEIVVRKEIDDFRENTQKWKKIINYFTKKTKVKRVGFLMIIFCRLILRNYFRIKNLHLRKIEFNYKDEE